MSILKASLFGKLRIQQGDLDITGIESRKVQELLSYLLIFRNHSHPRDRLCETLWGDQSCADPRKFLRQTLWRLQSALKALGDSTELELRIDHDWVQIRLSGDFQLDIEEFEKIFHLAKAKSVPELSPDHFKLLEYAATLYKGDLLEGWHPDWCVFERERFQTMHLLLLDKLVQICEFHERYEAGLAYGMEILRHDHAYERTHRQMMRLYYLTGNRTQALRQYERCVAALRSELDVEPSESTKQLYQQIRRDNYRSPLSNEEKSASKIKVRVTPALKDMLHNLKQVAEALSKLEQKVQEDTVLPGEAISAQR
jgi:DNA-binding SARP family transcriptional activator